MEYLILILAPESWADAGEADRGSIADRFLEYEENMREAGVLVGADPLQPPHTATVVSRRNGDTVTTDGPYAETKEWLAGYFKIAVESLDEAIEWASQAPSVKVGARVEVRPVLPIAGRTRAQA